MSQPTVTLHPMWHNYPNIQIQLEAVLDRITQNIQTSDDAVQRALVETFQSGGKLLRPAFTILIASFNEVKDHEALIQLAATVEMLHAASLIHDDIIDDSPTRRHVPSFQARFGKDVAVYAGDILFALTFRALADYTDDIQMIRKMTRYLETILNGELTQRVNHYNLAMTIDNYKEQIAGKTAALFELSAQLGLSASRPTADFANKALSFANNVGMAFQILDDILDYTSDDTKLGKPALHDIREGVYTAPLILTMQNHQGIGELLAKRETITDDELRTIKTLVVADGGVEKAQSLALQYTEQAMSDLDNLPDHESKDILIGISQLLLARED